MLTRLRKLSARTKTDFDDTLIKIFLDLRPPFYLVIALYFAIQPFSFPDIVSRIISGLLVVVIVYEVIKATGEIINYLIKKYLGRKDGDDHQGESIAKTAKIIVKIALWILGIIVILSNLGVDVTSLVASLGIGGLAVALALQNILKDVFSSFSIYVDKPFREGDFIVIGEDKGVVQKIGLKTTRVKTLQGEELVISNQELTSARVQNFKKMEKRRVSFRIGVTYSTPEAKLKKIPEIIESIITNKEKTEFDRCHFFEYADSSLIFEIVFYINSPEYNAYMDIRQSINIEIYTAFKKLGVEFAYPTQTILLDKS